MHPRAGFSRQIKKQSFCSFTVLMYKEKKFENKPFLTNNSPDCANLPHFMEFPELAQTHAFLFFEITGDMFNVSKFKQ